MCCCPKETPWNIMLWWGYVLYPSNQEWNVSEKWKVRNRSFSVWFEKRNEQEAKNYSLYNYLSLFSVKQFIGGDRVKYNMRFEYLPVLPSSNQEENHDTKDGKHYNINSQRSRNSLS